MTISGFCIEKTKNRISHSVCDGIKLNFKCPHHPECGRMVVTSATV